MTARKIAGALAISGMLIAGTAFAQTGSVSTTSNSVIPTTGTTGTGSTGVGAGATTQTGSMSGTSTTPGVPNTGGGDTAANLLLLGTSALIALGGAAYLSRRWARS